MSTTYHLTVNRYEAADTDLAGAFGVVRSSADVCNGHRIVLVEMFDDDDETLAAYEAELDADPAVVSYSVAVS